MPLPSIGACHFPESWVYWCFSGVWQWEGTPAQVDPTAYLRASTHQHFNTIVNKSTHQHINTIINKSTHQHINKENFSHFLWIPLTLIWWLPSFSHLWMCFCRRKLSWLSSRRRRYLYFVVFMRLQCVFDSGIITSCKTALYVRWNVTKGNQKGTHPRCVCTNIHIYIPNMRHFALLLSECDLIENLIMKSK